MPESLASSSQPREVDSACSLDSRLPSLGPMR
eukprot:COSAG04_NODE_4699_length_1941_cov_1.587948_1_plen_31_part_10